MSAKFNIGDKVTISPRLVKWYLSKDGIDCHYTGDGKHDAKDLAKMIVAMWTLCAEPNLPGVIVDEHHIGTDLENYKVLIAGYTTNIEPKHLQKAR